MKATLHSVKIHLVEVSSNQYTWYYSEQYSDYLRMPPMVFCSKFSALLDMFEFYGANFQLG